MKSSLRAVLLGRSRRLLYTLDFAGGAASSSLITYAGGANGTRVNSSGLIESASAPRVDYNPVSLACLGLLIEEGRVQRELRTRDLSNAYWVKRGTTSPVSGAADPYGGTSAFTLTVTGVATDDIYNQVSGFGSSASVAPSCVLKKVTNNKIWEFRAAFGAGLWRINTALMGNGFEFINENHPAVTVVTPWVASAGGLSGAQFCSQDGTAITFIYGTSQIQEATFSTSQIDAVAAAVTRTADSATITGSAFTGFYNQGAGAYSVEFDVNQTSGTRPVLSIDDNTTDNRIELFATGTSLKLTITAGGVTQCDLTLGTVTAGTMHRAAFSYATNNVQACLDGGVVVVDTSVTLPVVDRERLGSNQAGNYLNGHIKERGYEPSQITASELQRITR